jgi:hypothetical protein
LLAAGGRFLFPEESFPMLETPSAGQKQHMSRIASPAATCSGGLVSIIIPTYHEADNLQLLVPQITTALRSWPHETIIVDDDSNDGTDQVVSTLSEEGHAVRLIVRTDQRGLSSAVLHLSPHQICVNQVDHAAAQG